MRDRRDPRACSECGFPVGACECSSLRRDPTTYETAHRTSTDVEDPERYVTEAVESGVLDRDGEPVGHVGLFDLDGVGRPVVESVARETPGISVALRSSGSGWHIWSLAVRPLSEWTEAALDVEHVDPEHVSLSENRGCGVLRTDAKVSVESGETVKPAPAAVLVERSETSLPLSEPHGRALSEDFDVDIRSVSSTSDQWVGDSTDRRVYMADVGGRSGGR